MSYNLNRICTSVPRCVSILTFIKTLPRCCSRYEADVMDDFTSQLMQRKITKWDSQRRKNGALTENGTRMEDKKTNFDVRIGTHQLGLLFQNAIDADQNDSVVQLVNLCVQHNRVPPFTVFLTVLSDCSQKGNKDAINKIKELSQTHYPSLLAENSNFRHFMAKAIWIRGDISKALEIFEEVYRENGYLRRHIRLMLNCLISQLVSNGSEAALGNMISFSERISKEFSDFFPLTYVWQACFLSEWFTDQCVAFELLERHNGLCKFVINRIPYVVFVSLRSNRTEVVYRLMEILLKYKMKQQYASVLVTLLDYHFRRMDWMRCSEIVRWAEDNDVPVSQNHHFRLINLMLSRKTHASMALVEQKPEEKPKYNLKF